MKSIYTSIAVYNSFYCFLFKKKKIKIFYDLLYDVKTIHRRIEIDKENMINCHSIRVPCTLHVAHVRGSCMWLVD